MENNKLVCKACGNDSFAQVELGGSYAYANVKPIRMDKLNITGSPMILTICKNCGEIASMKVKKLDKFK
ncbi:hypothetical protein B1B04_15310 [Lysinibacillus sp. KCTC 33748]|uniref:hypothetical protein n=1 Tax=unclassified Lysinibacillus TaxID=2636778 RepID=UPI0009A5D60E|nr:MULTISPECIES: hypothetical protein [unclassified Lysinibacillus]OXS72664.1 hypothetical protein B1B04_15310 [Lysinibacillus sp. KCTC 33748]